MENNNPPQVITRPSVVPVNERISLTSMFSVVDPDPNSTIVTYQVRDNGVGGSSLQNGIQTLAPNVWHEFPAGLIGSVTYFGDQVFSSETYSVRVFDGVFWSNLATGRITAGNVTPEVIGRDGRISAFDKLPLTQFFTVTDGDNDAIQGYFVADRQNDFGGGQLILNGVPQAQASFIFVPAADIGNLEYRGAVSGPRAENIGIIAYDGFSYSEVVDFEIRTTTEPVITGTDATVLTMERKWGGLFFNTLDEDGDAIQSFVINDYTTAAASGYWEFMGVEQAAGTWFSVAQSELDQLFWVGADVGPADELVGIQAYDGFQFSEISNFTIQTVSRPELIGRDATVQANHFLNLATGGVSPISGTLPTGDSPILDYVLGTVDDYQTIGFVDRFTNGNGGGFYVNGDAVPNGQWFFVDADQLDTVEYKGGLFGPQFENISALGVSNGVVSAQETFRFDTLENLNAPTLTVSNAVARLGTVMNLDNLFAASDADLDLISLVRVFDTGTDPLTGFISRDGVQIAAGEWHEFAYGDLGAYKYHFPNNASTESIRFQVSDGFKLSTMETALLRANPTPTLASLDSDVSLNTLESVAAGDFFVQTDGGLPLTRFQVYDEFVMADGTDRSGRLFLREPGVGNFGEQLQGGVVHTLTAEEFSRLDFQGAEADFGRQLDPMIVRATNDTTGWTEWQRVNVNTDPIGNESLVSGVQVNNHEGGTRTVVTYTFIDGGNQGGGTRTNPSRPLLPDYYITSPATREALATRALSQPQRESIREVLDNYEVYANLDFVEVSYDGFALDAEIVFGAWGFDDSNASAYAYLPDSIDGRGNVLSDIWFNSGTSDAAGSTFSPETPTDVELGSFWRYTVAHEVGHALGMKHPFEDAPALSIFNNFDYNTVMAYQHDSIHNKFEPYLGIDGGEDYPTSLALYDIVEMQRLYGANADQRIGNDHYGNGFSGSYPHFIGNADQHQTTIWDSSGIDTLNFTNHGISVIDGQLDLNFDGIIDVNDGGTYSGRIGANAFKTDINIISGAFDINADAVIDADDFGLINDLTIVGGLVDIDRSGAVDGQDDGLMGVDEVIDTRQGTWTSVNGVAQSLRIAYDTVIENARGGNGDDRITGNETSNLLFGNRGNDTIFGGGGDDIIRAGEGDDVYGWKLGDGRDIYREEGNGGVDEFKLFNATGDLNDFRGDVVFSKRGNDLRVDFRFDGREGQGTALMVDFANTESQIELMAIHDQFGAQIGNKLDLTSVWSTATSTPTFYQITDTEGANGGFLGVPV